MAPTTPSAHADWATVRVLVLVELGAIIIMRCGVVEVQRPMGVCKASRRNNEVLGT